MRHADSLPMLVLAARDALVKERTLASPRLVDGVAGLVLLSVNPDGVVSAVRVVTADEPLRGPLASLSGQKTPMTAPDTTAPPIVRAGLVNCTKESGCALVLLLPEDTPAILQ